MRRKMIFLALLCSLGWMVGCQTVMPPSAVPLTGMAERGGMEEGAPAKKQAMVSPGLGTGFGDHRESRVHQRAFVRSSVRPAATASLFYNDRAGAQAMARGALRRVAGSQEVGGLVEWGVRTGWGFAPTYEAGGERFVLGKAGRPYRIWLRNRTAVPVEVVLSVDGLSVLDGKRARHTSRGYLIDPGEVLEIEGWRTSVHGVAQFEFSEVADSYSQLRHGTSRDVGVIGLAVFTPKSAFATPPPVRARREARAFAP